MAQKEVDLLRHVLRGLFDPILVSDVGEEAIRRERSEYFIEDGSRRDRFKSRFADMMNDKSMTCTEKVEYYVGEKVETDEAALDLLKDIWKTMIGEDWPCGVDS